MKNGILREIHRQIRVLHYGMLYHMIKQKKVVGVIETMHTLQSNVLIMVSVYHQKL